MKNLKPVSSALCFFGLSTLGSALYLLCFSSSVFARDGFSVGIKETAVFDTNPLMRPDNTPQDTIRGIESTASVEYKRENRSRVFMTDASIRRNQFDISGYNTTDFFFNLNFKRQTARWITELNGSVKYDTPRTSDENALGLTRLSDRRLNFSVSPSFIYKLSRRKSMGINTLWSETVYNDGSSLTDHQTQTVSPFLAYTMDYRNTLSVAFQYQQYQALSGRELTSDSVGPFLTWQHSLTPKTTIETSFGMLGTRYTGDAQQGDWEINPIYSFKIEHSDQQNTAIFSISRARQALTNGTESDITTAQISNEFAIAPKWLLNVKTEYKKAKQSSFSSDDLDNSYSAYIDTAYDVSRDLKFSMSYKYAQENYITNKDQASRNVIRASLDYKLK